MSPIWQGRTPSGSRHPRDLSIKRQGDCTTDRQFTTTNGLRMTEFCEVNYSGDDLEGQPVESVGSIEACMNICEESRPRCYGVSYNFYTNACWLKSVGMASLGSTVDQWTHSAVADTDQLQALNESCPAADDSKATLPSKVEYQVHCDVGIDGDDYCPSNGGCRRHASDLDECVQLCAEAHPLCSRVAFDPTLIDGYDNCYLKNQTTQPMTTGDVVWHSATLILPTIPSNCSEGQTYASENDKSKTFSISCGQQLLGDDIPPVHSESLEACMEQCATYSNDTLGCNGVSFQASMSDGYQNCYMQNSIGPTNADQYYMTAVLNTTLGSSSVPSTTYSVANSGSTGGSSKDANIALGTGIGIGVPGLILTGVGLWLKLRKKPKNKASETTPIMSSRRSSATGNQSIHSQARSENNRRSHDDVPIEQG